MKIIFLDMDGVLCTNRSHEAQGRNGFHHPFIDALDREGIGMLNSLQEKFPDILYVLSSTWRKNNSKEKMEEYLNSYGWEGKFHEDWRTDQDGRIRGDEIARWLEAHPDTQEYIILDDASDMREDQKYHFVQTDSYDGIRMTNFWHMERIFGRANETS